MTNFNAVKLACTTAAGALVALVVLGSEGLSQNIRKDCSPPLAKTYYLGQESKNQSARWTAHDISILVDGLNSWESLRAQEEAARKSFEDECSKYSNGNRMQNASAIESLGNTGTNASAKAKLFKEAHARIESYLRDMGGEMVKNAKKYKNPEGCVRTLKTTLDQISEAKKKRDREADKTKDCTAALTS